jgi:hypothetical protein
MADSTIYSAKIATSIALTGTPTAPTGTVGDTSTQIATNAFVAQAVSASGASSHRATTTSCSNVDDSYSGKVLVVGVVDNSVNISSSATFTEGFTVDIVAATPAGSNIYFPSACNAGNNAQSTEFTVSGHGTCKIIYTNGAFYISGDVTVTP